MATATTIVLNGYNASTGQSASLTLYSAGNETVGARLNADYMTTASSDSPKELQLQSGVNIVVTDVIVPSASSMSGNIRIFAGGSPTSCVINLGACSDDLANRQRLRFLFVGGVPFSFRVDTAITSA